MRSHLTSKLVLLGLIGAIAPMGLLGCSSDDANEEPSDAVDEQRIALTLRCDGLDDEATPAIISIGNAEDMRDESTSEVFGLLERDEVVTEPDAKPFDDADLIEHEAKGNEEILIPVEGDGSYRIYVDRSPVNPDGSTYSTPGSALDVKVSDGAITTEARIILEPLATEDMSKEQLELAAATLVSYERRTEARNVLKLAETAPTAEEIIANDPMAATKDMLVAAKKQKPETGTDAGTVVTDASGHQNIATDAGSSAPVANAGTNASQAPQSRAPQASGSSDHEHVWTKVVDEPAYDEPTYKVTAVCDQCRRSFASVEAWMAHLKRGGSCSSHTDSLTATGSIHHAEKSHYECSICHASK